MNHNLVTCNGTKQCANSHDLHCHYKKDKFNSVCTHFFYKNIIFPVNANNYFPANFSRLNIILWMFLGYLFCNCHYKKTTLIQSARKVFQIKEYMQGFSFTLFFYKNIIFPVKADYYFPTYFRLNICSWIFLAYSLWHFCFRMYLNWCLDGVQSNFGASLTHITSRRSVTTIEHGLLSAVFVAFWLILPFVEFYTV